MFLSSGYLNTKYRLLKSLKVNSWKLYSQYIKRDAFSLLVSFCKCLLLLMATFADNFLHDFLLGKKFCFVYFLKFNRQFYNSRDLL